MIWGTRRTLILCCFDWISSLRVGRANCCRQNLPCSREPPFGLHRSSFISAEHMQPLVVRGPLPNHLFLLVSSVLAGRAGAISPVAAASLIRAFIPLGHSDAGFQRLFSCPDPQDWWSAPARTSMLDFFKTNSCVAATHHTRNATQE